MIKFFRKIRQTLLAENPPERASSVRAGKFSKYLLYAIDEIVPVIITFQNALPLYAKRDVRKNPLKSRNE